MQKIFSPEINEYLRIKKSIPLNIALIVFGSLFVAFCSQISIYLPFSPVPFTGQTFAVLLLGAVLGPIRGGISLALYVFEGLTGLPFFANGNGGIAVLFGPTAGYLVGFIPAAVVVGLLIERGFYKNKITIYMAFICSLMIIYLCGAVRLSAFVGIENVFRTGIAPFVVGDLAKAGIAALIVPCGKTLLKRNE